MCLQPKDFLEKEKWREQAEGVTTGLSCLLRHWPAEGPKQMESWDKGNWGTGGGSVVECLPAIWSHPWHQITTTKIKLGNGRTEGSRIDTLKGLSYGRHKRRQHTGPGEANPEHLWLWSTALVTVHTTTSTHSGHSWAAHVAGNVGALYR
jgi:hypothetical protein